jgi:lipoprotein NlpI
MALVIWAALSAAGALSVAEPPAPAAPAATEAAAPAAAQSETDAALQAGLDAYARGQADAARKAFTTVIEAKDASSDQKFTSLLHRGRVRLFNREFKAAVADETAALEIKQDAGALTVRGLAHEGLGAKDQALSDYSDAIKLDPAAAEPYFDRGVLFADIGKADLARADLDKAIELNPKSAAPYRRRATLEAQSGEFDAAIADLGESLKRSPNPGDHMLRSQLYHSKKLNDSAALSEASAALAMAPDDLRIRQIKGALEVATGDPGKGLSDLDAVVLAKPTDPGVRRIKGEALLHLARYQEAAVELGRALDAKSVYPALELHLARLRAGDDDKAELVRNTQGLGDDAWPRPIVAYFQEKISLDELDKAAGSGPEDTQKARVCEAAYYGGEAALAKGDEDAARKRLSRAAEVCPGDYAERAGAIAELKRLQ